jgi:hypothetical protein
MLIKLKGNRVYRNTVEGEDIIVGGEPKEVKDSIGQYILDNFPNEIEKVEEE